MRSPFVPLAVPGTPAPAAPSFQPLSLAGHTTTPVGLHTSHPPGPPKVTLQRNGNQVTHIRIECGCGEVIELACEY